MVIKTPLTPSEKTGMLLKTIETPFLTLNKPQLKQLNALKIFMFYIFFTETQPTRFCEIFHLVSFIRQK